MFSPTGPIRAQTDPARGPDAGVSHGDSRTVVPSANVNRSAEQQAFLAGNEVFRDERVVKFLNLIAHEQASNYRDGLRFHERFQSRSRTILGNFLNFLDWRGQESPELLKTSYAWIGKADLAFTESFIDVRHGELRKVASRVLEDLYKTGLVEPVYVTTRTGLALLGIRITSQQLFDAVK